MNKKDIEDWEREVNKAIQEYLREYGANDWNLNVKFTDTLGNESQCAEIPHRPDFEAGMKFDSGKLRWDLLPFKELEDIVKVLTFGANKYKDNNWMFVENAKSRYFAAAMRHLAAYQKGELIDEETGLTHLSHAATNLMFLMFFNNIQ